MHNVSIRTRISNSASVRMGNESGARTRRNLVPGAPSRAMAFSFTASSASTWRRVTVVLSWRSPGLGRPLHSAAETMSRSTQVDFANHRARIESTNSSSHDLRIVPLCKPLHSDPLRTHRPTLIEWLLPPAPDVHADALLLLQMDRARRTSISPRHHDRPTRLRIGALST